MLRASACTAIVLATALVSAAGPALADGCGGGGWRSGGYTMEHEGVTRHFRVHLPTGYRNEVAAPLVLVFHGWGGDENDFLDSADVTAEADRRGYVLLAPRGLGAGPPDNRPNSWSFRGSTSGLDGEGRAICDDRVTPDYRYPSCIDRGVARNGCAWTQCQADDIGFTLALVELARTQLCIDGTRLFATGGSNGGMFAWELGQNPRSAPLLRAIAPVIGLPHRGYLQPPARSDGLPVLLLTGTLDDAVPPGAWESDTFTTTSNDNDRFLYASATAITRSWARAQDCDVSVAARPFDDGVAETDCRSWCAVDGGWPEVLDCRARMGHDYGLPWSWRLVLEFFDRHSR
jgi:poly(3-hydroxybutyrate) depolymerase